MLRNLFISGETKEILTASIGFTKKLGFTLSLTLSLSLSLSFSLEITFLESPFPSLLRVKAFSVLNTEILIDISILSNKIFWKLLALLLSTNELAENVTCKVLIFCLFETDQ